MLEHQQYHRTGIFNDVKFPKFGGIAKLSRSIITSTLGIYEGEKKNSKQAHRHWSRIQIPILANLFIYTAYRNILNTGQGGSYSH